MRRLVQNILLLLASSSLLIIVFEVVLRTTHLFDARLAYSKPDSVLAYRFIPGAEYYHHKENPKAITGTFNNFGWRDRDWNIEKSQGVTRIAVLGDSFVEAFQVELESTFVRLTEQTLRAEYKLSVELMNFGRSGFTQTDQLLLLQSDVDRFSPDIVIISFLPFNDIEDVRRETAPDSERPFFLVSGKEELHLDTSFNRTSAFAVKSRIDGFKRRSALLSLLAERYSMYKLQRDIGRQKSAVESRAVELGGYMSLCTSHPDSEYSRSYRLNKLLIAKMAEYCNARGASMVLMCLNTDAYEPSREQHFKSIDPTFDPNFFEDDLKELSSTLQIHYLGLQRRFREAYDQRQTPLHWGHWNYSGHRIVAALLSRELAVIIQVK